MLPCSESLTGPRFLTDGALMCEYMLFSPSVFPWREWWESDSFEMGRGLAWSLLLSLSLYFIPLSHPEACRFRSYIVAWGRVGGSKRWVTLPLLVIWLSGTFSFPADGCAPFCPLAVGSSPKAWIWAWQKIGWPCARFWLEKDFFKSPFTLNCVLRVQ